MRPGMVLTLFWVGFNGFSNRLWPNYSKLRHGLGAFKMKNCKMKIGMGEGRARTGASQAGGLSNIKIDKLKIGSGMGRAGPGASQAGGFSNMEKI